MASDIHTIVKNTNDLDHHRPRDAIDEAMATAPPSASDVEASISRPDVVARHAARNIRAGMKIGKRIDDQGFVGASLNDAE